MLPGGDAAAILAKAAAASRNASASDDGALPSLFWDKMPENVEQHPDYVAMQALALDSTPEERAESFKIQGNNKLKAGVQAKNNMLLREAAGFYGQGLAERCSDPVLNAVLHSNRAQVESVLGNWRRAYEDGLAASKLDSKNLKAYFRAARAALKLQEHDACLQLCRDGLAAGGEPALKELLDMQQVALQKKEEECRVQERRVSGRQAESAQFERLVDALGERGVRMVLPEGPFHTWKQTRPWQDEQGLIHWRLMLTFPEAMQQDTIEDVCEDDVIADHLDVVFGPDAPPLVWDSAKEYARDRVQLYYLANVGRPLGKAELLKAFTDGWIGELAAPGSGKRPAWMRAPESITLGELLKRPDHVVAGAPTLYVLSRGNVYCKRFLEAAG